MKRALLGLVMFVVASSGFAVPQQEKPMTLKAVLLEQLRSTHNKAEWFVPANTAVAGLTPEQASWTDKSWNETVQQLDQVMTDWERAVESADDAKVALWASRIAHVGAHNAYHIGQ